MARTRIRLSVYLDLDDIPGAMHTAESACEITAATMEQAAHHYNPRVYIDSYDLSKENDGYAENH